MGQTGSGASGGLRLSFVDCNQTWPAPAGGFGRSKDRSSGFRGRGSVEHYEWMLTPRRKKYMRIRMTGHTNALGGRGFGRGR